MDLLQAVAGGNRVFSKRPTRRVVLVHVRRELVRRQGGLLRRCDLLVACDAEEVGKRDDDRLAQSRVLAHRVEMRRPQQDLAL